MHTPAFPSTGTTLSEIATEAATQFQTTTRNTTNGPEPIVTLKDSTPPWLSQAIYEAHDGMLPDDWKFSTAQEACEAIAHSGGYEDMQNTAAQFAEDADIYTTDLQRWLTSHPGRREYCDTHNGPQVRRRSAPAKPASAARSSTRSSQPSKTSRSNEQPDNKRG